MKNTLLLFLASIISNLCFSQTLKIDLGNYEDGKEHVITPIISKFDAVELSNTIPRFTYDIAVKTEVVTMPTLAVPNATLNDGSSGPCDALKTGINELKTLLNTTSDEGEVKKKIEEIDKVIGDDSGCTDDALKNAYFTLRAKTISTKSLAKTYTSKQGQNIVLTISSSEGKNWSFKIKGEEVGKWFVHYGFGFASPIDDSGTYFSESVPDTTLFNVSKKESRGGNFEYLPSVLFSFIPYKKYDENFFFSLTGGVGANTDNIAVLFGGSLFYRQNLGINFTLIGKNQSVLDGRYREDGTSQVAENLDFDQLHEEKFRFHWGVSISYRFGSNPFSKNESESDE